MFTVEERDAVRNRVLEMAKSDPHVTAGALTGSSAMGAEDKWSDVDLAFGIIDSTTPEAVLNDWTETLTRELGVLHYWDLPSGSSIYRVFLLPSGLEIDLGVTPQKDFGARGPSFRSLFGTPLQFPPSLGPNSRFLVGLGWHHVFHGRSAIERGKPWRAVHWINEIREHTLTLAGIRLGIETYHGRGTDCLPASVLAPLEGTLVCSLEAAELSRALGVATARFISELDMLDPALCASLKPLLQEFGAP